MSDFINFIAAYFPQILFALAGISLIIFSVVALFGNYAPKKAWLKKGAKTKDLKLPKVHPTGFFHKMRQHILGFLRAIGLYRDDTLSGTFNAATKWIREHFDGPQAIYDLPWIMVVGGEDSGKTAMVESLSISKPNDAPNFADNPVMPALKWHFFDNGILLDVNSNCFLSTNKISRYRNWRALLRSLIDTRPQRPLEGLVLTIPVDYFIGQKAMDKEALLKHAQTIAHTLRQTEKYLGLRIPLYVALTKTDQIAGFTGLCNSLPKDYLNQILGWSTPYFLNTAFTADWVDEAMNSLYQQLTKLSFDILEAGSPDEYRDDVVVFAAEIVKLRQGLKDYLTVVCQNYNYMEHFYFRGLYFTGRTEDSFSTKAENVSPLTRKEGDNGRPLAFLNDLFNEKIFAEKTLATPIKRLMLAASRRINILKGLFAILLIGASISLYMGRKQLSDAVRNVYPDLHKIHQTVHTINLLEKNAIETTPKRASLFFQENAPYVLNALINYENQSLRPYFLPAAWITPLKNKMKQALQFGFNKIITQSLYIDFIEKANHIFKYPLPILENKEQGLTLMHPLQTTEFMILQGYVDAVSMLEGKVNIYNDLVNNPSPSNFSALTNYLYNFAFEDAFIENHQSFLTSMIQDATFLPININVYQLLAQERLYTLFMSFIKRVLDPSFNYKFFLKLQNQLDELDNTKGQMPSLENLYSTLSMLQEFTQLSNNPKLSWLGNNAFNPGDAYTSMMNEIVQSKLFGKNFTRQLSSEVQKAYQFSKNDLKSYGSPLTGFFMQMSHSTDLVSPSDGVTKLLNQLNTYLEHPFMQETEDAHYATEALPGQLIFWENSILKIVVKLVKDYQRFLLKDWKDLHPDLQEPLKILAQQMLTKNLNNLLARAQTIVTPKDSYLQAVQESGEISQIENIILVSERFMDLLTTLQDADIFEPFIELKKIFFKQLMAALESLDRMLEQQNLYAPFYGSFDWWDGKQGVVYQAYDMIDRDGLKTYLTQQRQQIETLATKYAIPIIHALNSSMFVGNLPQIKLFEKWKQIVAAINKYKKKVSKNPISQLEKFILDSGNTITLTNCSKKIPQSAINRATNDFFESKLHALQAKIADQCLKLSGKEAIAHFNEISDYFNTHLAGRFPFTAELNPNTLPGNEATAEGILAFFELFDQLTPAEREEIKEHPNISNKTQLMAFINRIDAVKSFLNLYFMPRSAEGKPGLDFEVKFRANQIHEIYGHQVINWGVATGNNSIDLKSGKTKGRWEMGQITAFAFRWANDSRIKPLISWNGNPAYTNVENRAIFLYEGNWSMLRALMLNQATIQDGATPNDNSLLGFKIPISTEPRALQPAGYSHLYVRLIPKASYKAGVKHFTIPAFPALAPRLEMQY